MLVFLPKRSRRLTLRLGTTFVSSSAIHCADGGPSLMPHWYFQSWGGLNGGGYYALTPHWPRAIHIQSVIH